MSKKIIGKIENDLFNVLTKTNFFQNFLFQTTNLFLFENVQIKKQKKKLIVVNLIYTRNLEINN